MLGSRPHESIIHERIAMPHRCSLHCIVPPGLLLRVARSDNEEHREAALRTLALDHTFRQVRVEHATRLTIARATPRLLSGPVGAPHRTIYDQQQSQATELGRLARSEGQKAVKDPAVNEAFDGFGDTYKFYWEVLKRNSIDDSGMPMVGLVNYGQKYDNAFWDGEGHMFFGDGDGKLFTRLTKSVDVIGHELTHGVTQYTANLAYRDQSGALNESISDVFGSLVEQYAKGQSAKEASWLIGADIVGSALSPALRSLKEPGKANPHDDQPASMDDFQTTGEDNGGVHTNSGIPNHAFYVIATTIGGNAWEAAGTVWYDAMRDPRVKPNCDFLAFAKATLRAATQRFGAGGKEADAVKTGWEAVKIAL
jgi:Zn-dependent metalloprotease